jgi:hypothetical protein
MLPVKKHIPTCHRSQHKYNNTELCEIYNEKLKLLIEKINKNKKAVLSLSEIATEAYSAIIEGLVSPHELFLTLLTLMLKIEENGIFFLFEYFTTLKVKMENIFFLIKRNIKAALHYYNSMIKNAKELFLPFETLENSREKIKNFYLIFKLMILFCSKIN